MNAAFNGKSSEKSTAHLHCWPGGNAGVVQLKTCPGPWGGPRASWRTPGLWPTTLQPGMAINLQPGPPCMVSNREGCHRRIGGRPIPIRTIAASVTMTEHCRDAGYQGLWSAGDFPVEVLKNPSLSFIGTKFTARANVIWIFKRLKRWIAISDPETLSEERYHIRLKKGETPLQISRESRIMVSWIKTKGIGQGNSFIVTWKSNLALG